MRDLADELLRAKVKARLFGGDQAPRLGRLVILDRLGSGGMGTVYAAYDPRLDRRVAVKLLHAAGAEANARMLREARALGKLAHPNVIAIHDADEQDAAVHVVMELATGVPLRTWTSTPRAWRDVLRVMREAGAGLAAAHRAGLIHRDIKPDNILVGDDRTRVVDFGLADAATASDTAGTPNYMAPEVLAGEPATTASDQFSFGVTLYEALHGERPHAGTTRAELLEAARDAASARPGRTRAERPEAGPSAFRTTVVSDGDRDQTVDTAATTGAFAVTGHATSPPGWLHAIVKRALAADPASRFASMDDLVTALARDRRQRVFVAVAATALLIGAIGGAVAYRASTRDDRCDAGPRRSTAWNASRATSVGTALGEGAWVPTTVARFGDLASAWQASYRTVCEATRVRGDQSDRLLELRMRCLDRALDRFDTLVTTVTAQGRMLEPSARIEVASAVAQLPAPAACETLTDASELALPSDPAARARVKDAEHALDQAWAEYALGRYGPARAAVTDLERTTADLDVDALRAAILTLAATIESRIGEPAAARTAIDRALAASAKAHAPDLEHTVWTRLLRHELFAGNPARTIEWAAFAHAAATRAGLEGAEVDGIVAEAQRAAGQLAPARERLQRALASRDPLRPDQRAILELNLGSVELAAGSSERAEAAFRRGHDLARGALGDGHPSLGLYLDKLAEAERARGRVRDALARHETSVAIRQAAFGEHDRAVATARFHRGETLLEAGQLARAAADVEAARVVRAKLLGPTSARLGELDATLGDIAAAAGRRDDARVLYDRAAALDPRLELTARRLAIGASLGIPLPATPSVEPFAVDHVTLLAAVVTLLPADRARPLVAALHARWRAAGVVDAALSLAVGDALRAVGDHAAATVVYRAALAALADEPSRTRLRALRSLAPNDPAARAATAAMAGGLPELDP